MTTTPTNALLVSDALAMIRDQVHDKEVDPANQTWTDAAIFRVMTQERDRFVGMHPEAAILCTVARPCFTAIAAATETLGLDRQWMGPYVAGVVALLLMEDSEDNANLNQAKTQLDLARE
jgi:hypothetical protein